jgi:hypothetical protein
MKKEGDSSDDNKKTISGKKRNSDGFSLEIPFAHRSVLPVRRV